MADHLSQPSVSDTIIRVGPVSTGWLWSLDGTELWYYHKPDAGPAGTWAVDATTGRARHVDGRWGDFSPSRRYILIADHALGRTTVHDRQADTSWVLWPTGGRLVPSPDETEVAFGNRWQGIDPPWMRPADLYRMDIEGSERVRLGTTIGSPLGWRSNGRLLVVGRDTLDDPAVLREFDRDGATTAEWVLGQRLRGLQLSPTGRYLAYADVLGPEGPGGQFILNVDTGHRAPLYGPASLRWLPDESGALVIPGRRLRGSPFRVWRLRAPELTIDQPLTDPDVQRIDMEWFDWRISPAGGAFAYRSAHKLDLRVVRWPVEERPGAVQG